MTVELVAYLRRATAQGLAVFAATATLLILYPTGANAADPRWD